MKKLCLFIISLTLLFPCAAYSQSDSITFTSYYPAPYGSYDNFRLVQKTTGNDYSGSCINGTLYVKSTGDLQFCKAGSWQTLGGGSIPGDYWGINGSSIYLKAPYTKVGIGNGINASGRETGCVTTYGTVPPSPNLPTPLYLQDSCSGGTGGGIFTRQDTANSSSIPSDSGIKFVWWPKYASLLVGADDSGAWNSQTGWDSIAFGNNCKAPGTASAAFGYYSIANGDNSVAMGYQAQASGTDSVAIGYNASASGPYSVALGTSSSAGTNGNTKASIAIGKQAVASGNSSVAFGPITVSGSNSIGINVNNMALPTVSNPNTMVFWGNVWFGSENAVMNRTCISGLTSYGGQNPPMGYLVVDGSGNVYKTPSPYPSSSKKYKKDIQPLRDDFYRILRVVPKSFVWKDSDKPDIGVIAEEIDKLGLKNLVTYSKQGRPDGFKYNKLPLYMLMILKNEQRDLRQIKSLICQDHPEDEVCKYSAPQE